MDKDKKKKKKGKKERSKHSDDRLYSIQSTKEFDIEGVQKITLSPIAQRVIGCVVGEHVTTEDPWVFVRKELIEDNLDLHEESSEFLPVKQYVVNYPEPEILIGYDKQTRAGEELFYLCINLEAKDNVIAILEEHKAEVHEKLKNSIQKTPGEWFSYGSEDEVHESIIKNFRPLYEILLECKYPLSSEKTKFSYCFAENKMDGYVALLPGRFPIENIIKKKIDSAIQSSATVCEKASNTIIKYPQNKYFQYNYEYTEPKLSIDALKKLTSFVYKSSEGLFEYIFENTSINMHTDDYAKLYKFCYRGRAIVTKDIISFRDVVTCKGKKVSDVGLDPLTSGLLAVSYSRYPANHMYTLPLPFDEVNDTIFGTHLVLLWCITEGLVPKLYLHSYREVNALSYCPFKKNLLIGGCTNGQIVIWDLTGRLEAVETRESITVTEKKHRDIMKSMFTWVKNTNELNVVLPTALSALDYSHKAAVTKIQWILTDYEITRNGKINKINLEEESESMQFMSCSLDGTVLVWDLKNVPQGIVLKPRPKISQRLKSRPSALNINISEYRSLNNILTPKFKFIIASPKKHEHYPLTTMIIQNFNFTYKALNPETANDYKQRTYFESAKSPKEYVFTPTLCNGTIFGGLVVSTWTGHDFDQGQKVNSEFCSSELFLTVHDGPIRVCVQNVFVSYVVMTIGGTVFAIWSKHSTVPIFWRKSHIRYMTGIWTASAPMTIIVIRADSHFELWELNDQRKHASRIFRFLGNPIMDMFSDPRKKHVKKGIFTTSDLVGSIRMYPIPPARPFTEELMENVRLVEIRVAQKAAMIERLTKNLRKQAKQEDNDEKENKFQEEDSEMTLQKKRLSEKRISIKKVPSTFDKLTSNNWQEKQEKIMYEILLEKKKLNLAEIEQHKKPLLQLIESQEQKQQKLEKILANKDKIFENAQRMLYKFSIVKQRKKIEILIPDNVQKEMKHVYVNNYSDSEDTILKLIKAKQYRFAFDWPQMIADGKKRRQNMKTKENINKHYLRHLYNKRQKEASVIPEIFDIEFIQRTSMAQMENEEDGEQQ